jgi:hypothetical protein
MVIERFRDGPGPVYERAAARGRMLPDGVAYLDSWVDARDLSLCYQLMEAGAAEDLDPWIAVWEDLVEFEVVPLIGSAEAASRFSSR